MKSGHYEKFGENTHFVPSPLPESIELDSELLELYGEAMNSLGKLAEAQKKIPSKRQFLDVYIAKEAIFSSQIENINTTLTQVLEHKSQTKPENKDVQEVLNYIAALHHGSRMLNNNLPISSRLIKECHKVLLSGVRGESKTPGSYRKVPVFVGSLVPPPAHYIENLSTDLEKFVNTNNGILPLIKTGLAHVQFETIHPFLDGNGRIGRLLIVLMLMDYGLIHEPVLYPSFFFMRYKSEYYDRLDGVRTKGDYVGWIKYFLRGIKASANDVVMRTWAIDELLEDCTKKIETNLSKAFHKNADILLFQLCDTPVVSIGTVAELLKCTFTTAEKLVGNFIAIGILEQQERKKLRNKTYYFKRYLDILEKDFVG